MGWVLNLCVLGLSPVMESSHVQKYMASATHAQKDVQRRGSQSTFSKYSLAAVDVQTGTDMMHTTTDTTQSRLTA